jgi:hypothetical protein
MSDAEQGSPPASASLKERRVADRFPVGAVFDLCRGRGALQAGRPTMCSASPDQETASDSCRVWCEANSIPAFGANLRKDRVLRQMAQPLACPAGPRRDTALNSTSTRAMHAHRSSCVAPDGLHGAIRIGVSRFRYVQRSRIGMSPAPPHDRVLLVDVLELTMYHTPVEGLNTAISVFPSPS